MAFPNKKPQKNRRKTLEKRATGSDPDLEKHLTNMMSSLGRLKTTLPEESYVETLMVQWKNGMSPRLVSLEIRENCLLNNDYGRKGSGRWLESGTFISFEKSVETERVDSFRVQFFLLSHVCFTRG